MNKILIIAIFTLGAIINNPSTAMGEIYLSVGESLLIFEGTPEILSQTNIRDNKVIIRMPANQTAKIFSLDNKSFNISPNYYTAVICDENKSELIIETPPDINPITLEISINEKICELGTISAKLPPLETIKTTIQSLRENPEAIRIIRQIAVPLSITVTAASAGVLTVTATVGSANFAFNITQLLQQLSILRFYALGFLRFKRKKPWGKVLDKLTGKPLRGALVQIYENEFKKMKDAQITDADGRFSAIVAPGKYYLKISRSGFEVSETPVINVTSPDQILNLEIYLNSSLEIFDSNYIRKLNIWNRLKRILDAVNPYLLAFGTLIGTINVIVVPNAINYAGLLIYIILDTVKIYLAFNFIKPFGKVIDQNGKPVSLAVIRIFEEEKNLLLSTKVTDEDGRFNFLLSSGKYYLTCSKSGFTPYRSNKLTLSESGLAAIDIIMRSM